MTVHIVGHSRGLGEYLWESFKKDYKDVRGYSRTNGYNIENDVIKICYQVDPEDIVVLNAYADGTQIDYLKNLLYSHGRIIVMGSIAGTFADPTDLEYSKNKKNLESFFNEISAESSVSMLYLRLTGSSYQDYDLIYKSINFWLANPRITFIGYSTK